MYVIKRDGRKESVKFDKITARIKKLCYGLNPIVEPTTIAMKVVEGIYDGVTTYELDNLAAEVAATRETQEEQGKAQLRVLDDIRRGRKPLA